MDKQETKINFFTLTLLIVTLCGIGTVGYMVIEGWNFLDALYMVVITLATVGFKEVHALSPAGTIFTILLIVFGIFVLYQVLRVIGEYMLENKLEDILTNRSMERTLKTISGHYIICGYGRVGKQITQELMHETDSRFVVVERRPELIEEAKANGLLVINGDSTEEETLKRANIGSAKAFIVALGNDSDTVLTIVTAKSLNNDLFIVARANGDNTANKLLRIGANRVVSPHQIGGFRMANFAINPTTADFLDDIQDLSNKEIQISDVLVSNQSPVAGFAISEKLSNRNIGITILAIHRPGGDAIINPVGDAMVEAGDRLILLGTKDKVANAMSLITAGK